jgi:hypothetical protein
MDRHSRVVREAAAQHVDIPRFGLYRVNFAGTRGEHGSDERPAFRADVDHDTLLKPPEDRRQELYLGRLSVERQ